MNENTKLHHRTFNEMIKCASALYSEANLFNDKFLNELLCYSERLSSGEYDKRIFEAFIGEAEDCEDTSFVKSVIDYTLRFILSQRAKKEHFKQSEKPKCYLQEAKFDKREQAHLDELLKTLSGEEYFNAEVTCQYEIKKTLKKIINGEEIHDYEYILSFKVGELFNPVSVIKLDKHYLLDDEISVSLLMGKPFRQMPCVDKALKLIENILPKLFYVQSHSG